MNDIYFSLNGRTWDKESYFKNREYLLSCSWIDRRFKESTFSTFNPNSKQEQEKLYVCKTFASIASREKTDDTLNNLVLAGKCGTGKTHLAVAIVKKCIDNLVPARIMTVNDIVSLVRSTWRGGEKTELQIINELSELSVLAIDEIGATLETETEKNIISQIIDKRYSGMKKTIFITNLSKKGLEDCLGERSIDRIFSESKTLVFDWESKR